MIIYVNELNSYMTQIVKYFNLFYYVSTNRSVYTDSLQYKSDITVWRENFDRQSCIIYLQWPRCPVQGDISNRSRKRNKIMAGHWTVV